MAKLETELLKYCETKPNQCVFVQNAIDRYLFDLNRTDISMDWSKAAFAVNFIESLNHVDGTVFKLELWQKFIIGNLFGWYYKSGVRRFKTSYIEVPRKNGKTALAAAICLIGLVADTREDAQIYTCATTRDQASICYKAAKQMAQKSWLTDEQQVRIKQYECFNISGGYEAAMMKALSSDSVTLDGLKPYFAVIDEYHAHKTDEVYNVVKSGMGATINPLLFTITTAGFNKNLPCYTERKYCLDILSKKLKDDTLFSMVFSIDDTDDWQSPKAWQKANPNLNVSVNIDFLKAELTAAKNDGSKEINFKTKYLNVWTDTATTWIPDDKWVASGSHFTAESLIGRECFGGMDLSKSQDFSSLVLNFPPIGNETDFKQLYFFWIPEVVAKERHKRNYHNYVNWEKMGLIEFTQGDVIDHELIRKRINELADKYKIQYINYDAVFATTLVTELTSDGIELHPFRQGFMSMAAPTAELERLIVSKELNHGYNEVIRWMASNVLILRDPSGNMKVDKSKPENKVDGIVSNIMAIAAYMQWLAEQPKEKEYTFIKMW
jgi:phage terminase large subunit-like protein